MAVDPGELTFVKPLARRLAKTVLDLGGDRPGDLQTKVTVVYHTEPTLGFLVPTEMVEHYYRPRDVEINAVGRYAAFRQFQTSGRIVTDR